MQRNYRADIDGLRGISILAVLGFHIHVPFFESGFVGVDIFFVISGFLITRHLLLEYAVNGRIDLVGFWARRVKRLSPALLLVVFSLLLAGPAFLSRVAGEVGLLDRAAMAALLFYANHFALSQSGDYFSPLADTNPLLHMWSLSVEEQFYFLWPLVLLAFFKTVGIKSFRAMMWGIMAVSFLVCLYLSWTNPTVAFFLMPARAWELTSGALIACRANVLEALNNPPRSSAWLGYAGLLAIVYSIAGLHSGVRFPAPAALLPVAGACALIRYGCISSSQNGPLFKVITAKPLLYIGKISYPLYLWHWPILVCMRSQRLYEESMALDALGIGVSLILAVLTYEVVEKHSWSSLAVRSPKQVLGYGFAGSFLALALALASGMWVRSGWGYSPEESAMDRARRDMPDMACMFPAGWPDKSKIDFCYPDFHKPSLLLLGDSHANHWGPALRDAANRLNLGLGILTMNACRPLPGPVGSDPCIKFNHEILERLEQWKNERQLRGLILSARWPEGMGQLTPSIADRRKRGPGTYADPRAHDNNEALKYLSEDFGQMLELAQRLKLRILIILPSPVQHYAAIHCLLRKKEDSCAVPEPDFRAYTAAVEAVMYKAAEGFLNVRFMEPRKFMCKENVCPVVENGIIIYTDDDHISRSYSTMHSNEFDEDLNWLVRQ